MNCIYSSVLGSGSRGEHVITREHPNDSILVVCDASGRVHDLMFVNSEEEVGKRIEIDHTIQVFDPPFHGLSILQGKSSQWMLWNANEFRSLSFQHEEDHMNEKQIWFGKEYQIHEFTIYKHFGRIIGFKAGAIRTQTITDTVEEDPPTDDIDVEIEIVNPDPVAVAVPVPVIEERKEEEVQDSDYFFFSDDHIWYIQITLLIIAGLIILIPILIELLTYKHD